MKRLFTWIGFAGAIFIGLAIISWLSHTVPPHPSRSSTAPATGTVVGISEYADTRDIGIRLHNSGKNRYYINRGLEQGQSREKLDSSIRDKQVTLRYYNGGWDLFGERRLRHICEITVDNKVIYTELSD
jgi:hypothetical protein